MTIIEIAAHRDGRHDLQSQSYRWGCWLPGYIEVPAHLEVAVWATYAGATSKLRRVNWWALLPLSGSRAGAGTPAAL